jgi:hypothetical protein
MEEVLHMKPKEVPKVAKVDTSRHQAYQVTLERCQTELIHFSLHLEPEMATFLLSVGSFVHDRDGYWSHPGGSDPECLWRVILDDVERNDGWEEEGFGPVSVSVMDKINMDNTDGYAVPAELVTDYAKASQRVYFVSYFLTEDNTCGTISIPAISHTVAIDLLMVHVNKLRKEEGEPPLSKGGIRLISWVDLKTGQHQTFSNTSV